MNKTLAYIVAIIVIVCGGVGIYEATKPVTPHLGEQVYQEQFDVPAIQIGPTSLEAGLTPLHKFIFGTCNATQSVLGSQGATTSANFYCNVTGAVKGDEVDVSLPFAQGALYGGFTVNGAAATSSNTISFSIENLTGQATTSFPMATTGIAYQITD